MFGANLSNAKLSRSQGLKTKFSNALFTGACVEDWSINNETEIDNILCDYIYLKSAHQGRLPSYPDKIFEPGEFSELIRGTNGISEIIRLREEIKNLVTQLEESYPHNTSAEQELVGNKAIEKINSDPNLKQRIISAAREAGLAGFEKAFDSVPGAIITGAIRGWLEAE